MTEEVLPDPDPTGENARWTAAVEGLEKIAWDENETPARRALAQKALDSVYRSQGSAIAFGPPRDGHHHTRGGGNFLQTQAVEEGWGKP